MTMTTLPPEVLLRIFSNLGYRDLMSARRTCRQWCDLSMDEDLLHTIKERDFNQDIWAVSIWEEKMWGEEEQFPIPSSDEIGLAVFLGRDNVVEMNKNN